MAGDQFQRVLGLALGYPGVEEATSYGTPSIRVRKKFMARMKDDETLAIQCGSIDEKEFLMATEPEVFFQTPHYVGWPVVLVRLPVVTDGKLREMIETAWRLQAPAKLLKEHDARLTDL